VKISKVEYRFKTEAGAVELDEEFFVCVMPDDGVHLWVGVSALGPAEAEEDLVSCRGGYLEFDPSAHASLVPSAGIMFRVVR